MSIQCNDLVRRTSQVQTLNVEPQVSASPQGMASDPSTLRPFREHVNANESGSFCSCFESLINWIKGFFSNLMGSRASEVVPQRTAPQEMNEHQLSWPLFTLVDRVAPQPWVREEITHDRIIEKGNEYIDNQFSDSKTEGLSYPFKAIVCIKYNGVIIKTLMYTLASGLPELKETAKRELSAAIRSQDLQGAEPVSMGVITAFLQPESTRNNSEYRFRRVTERIEFRSGQTIGGAQAIGSTNDGRDLARVLYYEVAEGDRDRFLEMGNMFRIQNRDGSVYNWRAFRP